MLREAVVLNTEVFVVIDAVMEPLFLPNVFQVAQALPIPKLLPILALNTAITLIEGTAEDTDKVS